MLKNSLLNSELWGALVIFLTGSLLHFLFEVSGSWPPLALLAAVNESVWEHMKLAFWPALFYAVIQYFSFKDRPCNFWFAKTVNFYIITLIIPIVHYGHKSILGKHLVIVEIIIFGLAILLGQLASYKIMQTGSYPHQGLTVLGLLIIISAYSLLTYFPIHCELFRDPKTGGYGIPAIVSSQLI